MPAAILVVDDTPSKRLMLKAVLEPLGHTIVEAASGEDALRAVLSQDFAVILLDVQMEGMDGHETARLIRSRRQSERTPIIFITANARDEARVPEAYASGAVDFIFGAIDAGTLRAKVSVFVDLFLKSRELERSLQALRDTEARSRAVFDNVTDGIVTLDEHWVIESFNRAATGLFGYEEADAVGRAFSSMVTSADENGELTPQRAHGYDGSVVSIGRRRDGTTFPMELGLSGVGLGSRQIHIGCIRDVSERQSHTDTLRYQTLHDELTGLPNRALFADRVEHAIRVAARARQSVALLVLDLDAFKHVNDTLGHQLGDALLRLVAERLQGCLRAGDTVARLGGDEFGVMPLSPVDSAGALTVAWKIQQALEAPFLVEGHSLQVRASIGIVLIPEHGSELVDLLRRADLAMYDAKQAGTGYSLFAAEHEEGPARQAQLLSDLRRCVERDELVLHYQPKIDLKTRRTYGLEALIRWNHPSGRLYRPDEFMPEVENSDLMIPITEWVLNESLRQLRVWRDDGFDLDMAINIGARCLAPGTGLFEKIDELTQRWGIPSDRLTFELTEIALIDTTVPGLMERLESMNERLSIDDFGTGHSSLVYLQRLPVVEIKADRSFVTNLATTPDDAVIVRSTIDLAHNLSLTVVAEGVEDEATMNILTDYGCDQAQGYYFSKPIPGDELVAWFETSAFGTSRGLGVT